MYNGYEQYQRASVTSSSPETLIVLLYGELLRCLAIAREAQLQSDLATRYKHISKSIMILTELMVSLNVDEGGEIAWNLIRLYEYVSKRLLSASRGTTTEPFDEAIALLAPLKDAWETISVSKREPVPIVTMAQPVAV